MLIEKLEELTQSPNAYYRIIKDEHKFNCESIDTYYSWDENIKQIIQQLDWSKPIYSLFMYNGNIYEYYANSLEDIEKYVNTL